MLGYRVIAVMNKYPTFFERNERYTGSSTYGDLRTAEFLLLVDSHGYMDHSSYMGLVLALVWRVLGLAGASIVLSGATLRGFTSILPEKPIFKYKFVLVVSMGNDLYKQKSYPLSVEADLSCLDAKCKEIAEKVFYVYGGSASVWNYQGVEGMLYDEFVDRVVNYARGKSMSIIRGAHQLAGIKIKDKIGHVSARSYRQVVEAYVVWIGEIVKQPVSML